MTETNSPIPRSRYLVTLAVEKVVSGIYSDENITFKMNTVGSLNDWPYQGNHFMCLLKESDSGYSLSPLHVLEVYKESNGKIVAGRFPKVGYYEDTFNDYGRKIDLPESERFLSDGSELPEIGVDVERIAEFWISELNSEPVNNTPIPISSLSKPKAVDLGLSVKWADCNLGATRPQEHGAFYAWGETKQKVTYIPGNYKWCDFRNEVITKYYPEKELTKDAINDAVEFYDPLLPIAGRVDGKVTLDTSDDAVRQNLKHGWRTPTAAECQELLDNCDWELANFEGVKGYTVRSRVNGNSIFLPVTGYYSIGGKEGDSYNKVRYGVYMSSSLAPHKEECVTLRFHDSAIGLSSSQRSDGLVIRPVRD